MSHDVFISHSSDDDERVGMILAGLERKGVRCWVDFRDIPLDRPWPKEIMNAINDCTILLIVLSQSSAKNEQVAREAASADSVGKNILTIRLDNVSPGDELGYWVGRKSWFDAARSDLDPAVARLADRVRALLLEKEAGAIFRIHKPKRDDPEVGLGRLGNLLLRTVVRSLRLQSTVWAACSRFLGAHRKQAAYWALGALLVLFLFGRILVYPHRAKATDSLAKAVHGSKLKDRVRFDYLLLMGTNPDLHRKDSHVSAVVTAASDGNVRALQWLVRCGVDLNHTGTRYSDSDPPSSSDDGDSSRTPLMAAAASRAPGRIAVLKYLLKAGADVNARNGVGETALHVATDNEGSPGRSVADTEENSDSDDDDSQPAKLLLDAKADPAAVDEAGDTPLHCAVRRGDIETTKLLLDQHVTVNAVNKQGLTPLYLAAFAGSYFHGDASQTVKLLLLSGATHTLFTAAALDDSEAVRSLLASGASVNATFPEKPKYTPLSVAIENRHWGLARLLLSAGARANVVGAGEGYFLAGEKPTALVAAVSSGDLGLIKLLLDRGASVKDGDPLGAALSDRQLQIADFLRGKGATTQARN